MVIHREINDEYVSIQLTREEMVKAFFEQEYIFDYESIEKRIGDFLVLAADRGTPCTKQDVDALLGKIVEEYRHIREAHDWLADANEAFVNVLTKYGAAK